MTTAQVKELNATYQEPFKCVNCNKNGDAKPLEGKKKCRPQISRACPVISGTLRYHIMTSICQNYLEVTRGRVNNRVASFLHLAGSRYTKK